MDTEIKTLAQIKAMSGRNLDSSVNDSTLVSGETSAGTFGVFKFFQGIKNFFKNAQALATLTATSRITVTDADGNVTYTTPNAIKSTLGLATTSELNSALADYGKIENLFTGSLLTGGQEETIDLTSLEQGGYLISICGSYSNVAYGLYYLAKGSAQSNISNIITSSYITYTKSGNIVLKFKTTYTSNVPVRIKLSRIN